MSKTTVNIKKQKRANADQPYTVEICVGRKEPFRLKQRYSKLFAAKRAALRTLGLWVEEEGLYGANDAVTWNMK